MRSRALIISLLTVAGGMLLGRASGLLREMVLARSFGLSRAADLAMFAMTLPDLLTSLLIGGAVSAVLVPEYHRRLAEDGPEDAQGLLGQSLVAIGGMGCLLGVVLAVLAPAWVRLMAPGFEGQDRLHAEQMARIALLAFPLSAATAVVSAALQIQQRLTFATLGTLVFNLTAVVVIGVLATLHSPFVAAWAVVAGAALRLLVQSVAATRRRGLRGAFSEWSSFQLLSGELGKRYAQALAAIGLLVLLPVVARAFASENPGEAAAISYAIKLSEVPVGLCSAVLSMILLPRISLAFQSGKPERAKQLVAKTARWMLLLLVPGAVLFQWIADPVVRLVFQGGRLDGDSAALVANLARIAMLGVPASVLTALAMTTFHAQRNTATPLRWGLAVFTALLPATWLAAQQLGVYGVMAATVGASWVYAVSLTIQALKERTPVATWVPYRRAA